MLTEPFSLYVPAGMEITPAPGVVPGALVAQLSTATCAETMNCIGQCKPKHEGQGNSLFGCVVDSCPGASAELSAALRCQMTEGYGACSNACSGAGQGCASCMTTACSAQNAACQAVACH